MRTLSPQVEVTAGQKLPSSFYLQDTVSLARALLGKRLVRMYRGRRYSGLIVEVEAYLGANDPACHTWKNRKSERNRSMYLEGGHAYVYFIYGMHFCFNVVARERGEPEAVLIRALEPEEGVRHRTDGPGRLCRALHISTAQDGEKLWGSKIFLEETGLVPEKVEATPRIGVDYAGEAASWLLRFCWAGHAHLSRKHV